MINFDDATKENTKEDKPNRSQILDHQYRILLKIACWVRLIL